MGLGTKPETGGLLEQEEHRPSVFRMVLHALAKRNALVVWLVG